MMFQLLRRFAGSPAFETAGLGTQVIARPIASGCQLPPGGIGVVFDAAGHTRRVSAGGRVNLAAGDRAWCFHPGPYGCDLVPFAAAPEIGLRMSFAVDSPDPRVTQQRFDLYLASEAADMGEPLTVAGFAAQAEAVLQRELAQGNLELPPCTTLDEWNAFRGGFNQLMYTRFGVSIDDCVPVDLAGSRDYARELQARVDPATAPDLPGGAAPAATASPAAFDPAAADARALRRLFLELPCLMCRVRMAALPQGQGLFRQQQALLGRLDLVSLAAGTMPALALAAPGQPLAMDQQLRRARHSLRAAAALDEAWALLARLERADDDALAGLLDEADRIVANLEHDMDGRKALAPEEDA
ncbi:hypothetical protein [Massilia niabensis]|uniref:Uncharacterized protein n=1 Tax=Massilia niabensis TaxID=544910 RepID=A0ABW0L154_9BURK